MSSKLTWMKIRTSLKLFCEYAVENDIELLDVIDFYSYAPDEVWAQSLTLNVDDAISRITDYDMCTLLCRDNNYEPPAEMWVKLVPSNGWEDMVADYSYVPAESECKHKSKLSNTNRNEFENAVNILSDEELIWDYLCGELIRLENENKQLRGISPVYLQS